MKRPKFVVHQGKDGQWYLNLTAANGRILMSSEGYTRRRDAERAIKTVKSTVAAIRSPPPSVREMYEASARRLALAEGRDYVPESPFADLRW